MPYLHSLPYSKRERNQILNQQMFIMVILMVLSFAFVSVFSLVFIVFEKESEVKLHQFINSVSISVYWLSNLAWDSIMYLPSVSI